MMAQWIDVQPHAWTFRAEVIAAHKILGDHSGVNLGRQFVKLTDRVGITSKDPAKNKVSAIWLRWELSPLARLVAHSQSM